MEHIVMTQFEIKHINDTMSALTEYIIGEWTFDMLVRWLDDNTDQQVKEHIIIMIDTIESNKH